MLSLICLMLAVVMLLPVMFSCKKKDEIAEDVSGGTEAQYLDDLGDFDFEGYEFKALSVTSEEEKYTKFDVEELAASVLDNSIYYRNREIEGRFNVVLKANEEKNYGKCYDTLIEQSTAGVHNYDIIMLINRSAHEAAINGYLYPVESLTYVDQTKDYYLHDINEMISLKGKQFLVYSEESLYTFQRSTCIAYNKTMAEDLGITGLYDTVRNDEWTFDKFFEYAKLGTSVTGDGEVESYGIYGHGDRIYSTFFTAAGQDYIVKQNGSLKFTAGTNERMIEISETELNLMKENVLKCHYFENLTSDTDATNEVFKTSKALFCGTIIGELSWFKDIDGWDYGVLPWPKYDTTQESYRTRVVDAWLHVVPISNPDPEMASVILEALASGSAKWVFPAYYENHIQGRTLRDSDSVEMLEIVRSTRVFDWGGVTFADNVRAKVDQQVFFAKAKTLQNVCQTNKKAVNDSIKLAEDKVQELINSYGQ